MTTASITPRHGLPCNATTYMRVNDTPTSPPTNLRCATNNTSSTSSQGDLCDVSVGAILTTREVARAEQSDTKFNRLSKSPHAIKSVQPSDRRRISTWKQLTSRMECMSNNLEERAVWSLKGLRVDNTRTANTRKASQCGIQLRQRPVVLAAPHLLILIPAQIRRHNVLCPCALALVWQIDIDLVGPHRLAFKRVQNLLYSAFIAKQQADLVQGLQIIRHRCEAHNNTGLWMPVLMRIRQRRRQSGSVVPEGKEWQECPVSINLSH